MEGYSTTHHIHVVTPVIEKCAECNKPLYGVLIGYEKTFDSVDTGAVLKAVKDQRVEETYIKPLEDILKGCDGRAILHTMIKKLAIRKVRRQGDTLSSKLLTGGI